MSNTTVVPHLFGILRSSPFQQGAARYSQTRTALEEGSATQSYSSTPASVPTVTPPFLIDTLRGSPICGALNKVVKPLKP